MPAGKKASTSKTGTTADAPKKRGNPSDFKGARLEFLLAHLDVYAEHSKKKTLADFLPSLFHDYWCLYHWTLLLNEDPPPGCSLAPEEAETAFKVRNTDLSEDEMGRKPKVQNDLKGKIKCWFNRQRPGSMGIHANPYFGFLKQLRNAQGSAPKKLPDYQFYLQHEDFKDGVAAQFKEERGDTPAARHLALRCEIGCEMLAVESQEVKTRLEEESIAAHEAAMEKFETATDDLPSVDPEVQKEYRDNFLTIVAPLLHGIRMYTGYTLNLVAARIDGDKLDCTTANAVFQFFPLSVLVALKLTPIVLPSPPDTLLHTLSYPAPFR
ncbi:hypothetical protein B0H16DRAFT_1452097 [Mycena metata]|uniref:Uncharacterized protein n=1 Tax=Mycena metata TaxID=1033252 RepID=A0AAD7JRX3_9AGAR|nr:hypothetical protein B0H16DRAFT_1452097 [Mycena metata]